MFDADTQEIGTVGGPSRSQKRRWRRYGLAVFLAWGLGAAPIAAETLTVTVGQGRLEGVAVANGGALYADVPYAAPPVGERRWKAPAEPMPWAGVREAKAFGPTCPQPDMGWNSRDAAHANEDCLTLNVWVPAGAKTHIPVMVWFHGGAFIGGAGSAPTYDGAALSQKGVIVVTVNYRLGVLGFLAHPELSAENPEHVSGNYGLQDQLAALKWVHANIARFGGDPANVTMFGQSAGAISTANILAIPSARSLYQRAILESGTPFGIGNLPSLRQAEESNAEFGHLADLRAMPAGDLVASWSRYSAVAPALRRTLPVVDGRLLARQPADAFRAGAIRNVPILLGSNLREIPPVDREDLLRNVQTVFGAQTPQIISAYESENADPAMGDSATRLMTDLLFRCGTLATAGLAEHAWLYHFHENFPGRDQPAHSAEVFYVFDSSRSLSTEQRDLAEAMRTYWSNFATSGDPNGPGLPQWRHYTLRNQSYLTLSTKGANNATALRGGHCATFLAQWLQPGLLRPSR